MTVANTTISNLKTVDTSTGKKLRWVEEKRSWYWYDPSSSLTGDDENIVVPSAGLGRWLKQEGKILSDGLIYNALINTQTITASSSRYYTVISTNGIVTINLPASPVAGDTIKIEHLSIGLSNVTLINRNGKPIRGNTTSAGLELFTTYSHVVLTYIDATIGWNYSTSLKVRPQATYNQTFTQVSDNDENGLFYWLGTNEGMATFRNPTLSNGGVGAKIAVFNSNTPSLEFTDRSTGTGSITIGSAVGFTAFFYVNIDKPDREFRLSKLAIRASIYGGYALRNFAVYAVKSTGILSYTDMLAQTGADWTFLARYTNDLTMGVGASTWAYYDINATDFYSCYRIVVTGNSSNNTTDAYLGEFEFYGEVRS